MIERRSVLGAGLLALAAGRGAAAQTAGSATPAAPASPVATGPTARVNAALQAGRLPLSRAGVGFSGAGWDLLVREGRASQFFLLGEEHGVSEIPALSSALFGALRPAGYDRVAIEISPPMAAALDMEARAGLSALRRFLGEPANAVAFYTLEPEAAFLANVRSAVRGRAPMLWGLDYEVGADRRLIAELGRRAPGSARPAVQRLAEASRASWAEYEATRNPAKIFSFGGDPELVAAVRTAWPRPDQETTVLLDTLEETLRVNGDQLGGRYWQANDRRARLNRANLVRYLTDERAERRSPKVLFKFGSNHIVRGRNLTGVFDIGSLAAEAATLNGGTSFHLLVALGPGSGRAQFDPTKFAYAPVAANSLPEFGLEALAAPPGGGHTVVDLRPLRPLAGPGLERAAPALAKVIHGFDAVLVLDRATAAQALSPA